MAVWLRDKKYWFTQSDYIILVIPLTLGMGVPYGNPLWCHSILEQIKDNFFQWYDIIKWQFMNYLTTHFQFIIVILIWISLLEPLMIVPDWEKSATTLIHFKIPSPLPLENMLLLWTPLLNHHRLVSYLLMILTLTISLLESDNYLVVVLQLLGTSFLCYKNNCITKLWAPALTFSI